MYRSLQRSVQRGVLKPYNLSIFLFYSLQKEKGGENKKVTKSPGKCLLKKRTSVVLPCKDGHSSTKRDVFFLPNGHFGPL